MKKKRYGKTITRTCIKCKKEFQAYIWNVEAGGGKYCSRECQKTSQKRNCIVCGKEFTATRRNIDRGGGKFCSHSCQRGKYNPFWHGGKTYSKKGYVYIRKPDHPNANPRGYVAEHRLIMEEELGRYLNLSEVIHHKNGIRDDNRVENLELFINHSEHMKTEHTNLISNILK